MSRGKTSVSLVVKMIVSALVLSLFVPSVSAAEHQSFTDVDSSHPYFQAIHDLSEQNVIAGFLMVSLNLDKHSHEQKRVSLFTTLLTQVLKGSTCHLAM